MISRHAPVRLIQSRTGARPYPRRLKAGALFAGYGGLELGLAQVLDVETSWVAEVDRAPSHVLATRFPGVPNLGDVTQVDWSAVEPVDVVSGGSPCQDLSNAGHRAGMRPGTRSGLWASMCDAVDIIRPQLVVWENVRGALNAPATTGHLERCDFCMGEAGGDPMRALGRVLGDLAELGYDAGWTGVRASDVGAPHGRFRVFVLAWPAADSRGETGQQWPGLRTDEPAWDGRGLAARGSGSARTEAVTLLPTPAVNDMGAGKAVADWDAWTARMKSAHGNGNGHGKSLAIEALRMLPTPRATDGTKGGPNQRGSSGDRMLPSAVTHRFRQYAPAVARWESILGRPAPDPTEATGKGGAARLSPRFVEWMMGLPDGWVTGESVEAWRARLQQRRAGGDTRPVGHRGSVARRTMPISRNDALKALGNGVVPHQAAAAVRHLLALREQVRNGMAA